ncbi:unnamed protein product [Dibothriocephalus latus]|uniref:Uncharacterized protein n=1 Tax=Dibothriocephalus latus TaxID=60516 RepID=A0A3P7NRA6_DIBLA|nr:unnamed protein product [Dibothriocephalus latus]
MNTFLLIVFYDFLFRFYSRSSSGVALRGRIQPKSSSLANLTFRNDDFYTVIYLFTAICPSLGRRQYASAADGLNCPHPPLHPPHQHLDRGLEHLALCIRALDHQLQPNTLLPFRLSSPHRAWAPCASSSEEEEVVNMPSVSSYPQLPSTGTPSPTEEFVLPAAIGGSRKETAYMRLNNKVRQIEANVSVSMRSVY